tara:strand:- start:2119 stop:2349 length:231 start_codon:yes stop_codon:yes gene_type:complete
MNEIGRVFKGMPQRRDASRWNSNLSPVSCGLARINKVFYDMLPEIWGKELAARVWGSEGCGERELAHRVQSAEQKC